MTANHYTTILHLAPILTEGITKGEITHPNNYFREQAVSLTTQTNPENLRLWSKPLPWKTAVRLVCTIPDGDPRLERAKPCWLRVGVPAKYIRTTIDPDGQAKWWYFWHGVIPPDWFTVEIRGRAGYVPLTGADLDTVAAAGAELRATIETVTFPSDPCTYMRFSEKTDQDFVYDPFPADRFDLRDRTGRIEIARGTIADFEFHRDAAAAQAARVELERLLTS